MGCLGFGLRPSLDMTLFLQRFGLLHAPDMTYTVIPSEAEGSHHFLQLLNKRASFT